MQVNTTKEPHFAEIQVRTIFEEGWSEIDHKIRYSSKKKNKKHPLEGYLLLLNGIAGNADETGKLLKQDQAEIDKKLYDERSSKKQSRQSKKGGRNA